MPSEASGGVYLALTLTLTLNPNPNQAHALGGEWGRAEHVVQLRLRLRTFHLDQLGDGLQRRRRGEAR